MSHRACTTARFEHRGKRTRFALATRRSRRFSFRGKPWEPRQRADSVSPLANRKREERNCTRGTRSTRCSTDRPNERKNPTVYARLVHFSNNARANRFHLRGCYFPFLFPLLRSRFPREGRRVPVPIPSVTRTSCMYVRTLVRSFLAEPSLIVYTVDTGCRSTRSPSVLRRKLSVPVCRLPSAASSLRLPAAHPTDLVSLSR